MGLVMQKIGTLRFDTRGATAAEYALILAVLGALIIAGLRVLGNAVQNSFNNTASVISNGS